jgi:hypothetical protein
MTVQEARFLNLSYEKTDVGSSFVSCILLETNFTAARLPEIKEINIFIGCPLVEKGGSYIANLVRMKKGLRRTFFITFSILQRTLG